MPIAYSEETQTLIPSMAVSLSSPASSLAGAAEGPLVGAPFSDAEVAWDGRKLFKAGVLVKSRSRMITLHRSLR